MKTLDQLVEQARTSTPAEAHKRRVLRVQSILFDFKRGALLDGNALALLEDAGVSPEGAADMIERHRRFG
jgi:hypothetical protein